MCGLYFCVGEACGSSPLAARPSPCLAAHHTPPVLSPTQVIYLGLVQVLDFRGGELLPPPPEAYEQY